MMKKNKDEIVTWLDYEAHEAEEKWKERSKKIRKTLWWAGAPKRTKNNG